jgi:uncharacterized protein YecE (DUF72 family)
VFSVKASRFCTNRKELGGAGESISRFFDQALHELKDRLGPINWQFMGTKKFDADDFEGFLKLLPREVKGLPLRHALGGASRKLRRQAVSTISRGSTTRRSCLPTTRIFPPSKSRPRILLTHA